MSEVEERWLPVVGYEGCYEVSSGGRVRGVERTITALNRWGTLTQRRIPARMLLAAENSRYLCVTLSKQTRRVLQVPVHVLVAAAFHGPRPEGFDVCHNDGDNFNNCADNLRYDTRRANIADSIRMGRHYRPKHKSHCLRGHEYTPENTKFNGDGYRYCRACHLKQIRDGRALKRGSA